MANILELKEERLNLQEELTNLVNQAETRSLEDAENGRLTEIRERIDAIDAEIADMEKENRNLNNSNNKTQKTMKEIRLFDLIKEVANGNVSEENRQYVQGNVINYRDIVASGASHGQEDIAEVKMPLDVEVRNASVLNKLGCVWFDNVKGDISIPRYAGSQVGWKGEIDAADAGDGEFSEVSLTPHRLTAYIDISRTFLEQDANSAEGILIRDLAAAVAEKLDQTVFGADAGTTNKPAGLFADTGYTVSGETAISGVSYDNVLALELANEEKNGTNFTFVMSPSVKYAYKGSQMASGLEMVYDGKELDGYKAIVSNSVVKNGIICMDPRSLAVASWGLTITVDDKSRAIYNQIRVVVNANYDAKLRDNKIAAEIYA